MVSRAIRGFCSVSCLILFAVIAGNAARAQAPPVSRIAQAIDDSQLVTLQGNVHPLAQPQYDQGAVPYSFPADRMLLILKRSPRQEAALRQFLEDAHTPGSPIYHKWITPEEFGKLYGPTDAEIATVTGWLRSHGFSVARAGKGKTTIEFSGTAGQIRQAFHTQIHTYLIQGQEHHANNANPQIPAALAPLVAGITPINDFRARSNAEILGRAGYDLRTHQVTPQWTQNAPNFMLGPGDFAVQYDVNPILNAGTNGAGVTIGVIGDSNVDPTMVAAYRSLFSLPASPINVIIDGNDPGENDAQEESYLDVEEAAGVAPGATIDLYTAEATFVQDGINLAALRAVGDDAASVLTVSYGECEQSLGSSGNQFWAGVWEQAAAQGQTALVSSGDGGSAGCDDFDTERVAQYGLAVNGLGSTPWDISVGGTDFYYSSYNGTPAALSAQLATYWNQTDSGLPAVSLRTPIPEQAWDDPFGLNLHSGGVYYPAQSSIIAGSGGASSCATGMDGADGTFASCTGGYPKPAWQTGSGVPADEVRDLPDVALFAANGDNDSFYPICAYPGDCVVSDGFARVTGTGGTSASTPAMAGIMALVNQKFGRQGQANFTIYPLAAQHPSAFHDITIGSNNVPCVEGSPNCSLSTLSNNTNGFYTLGAYYAGKGYDLATGLGSIDASLLLQYWNSLTIAPTATTLAITPASFVHGTPALVSVSVSGSGGIPAGSVALLTTATPPVNTGAGDLTLQNGAAASTIDSFPGGQYQVTARYGGDGSFASSTSPPVTLDVTPETSNTLLSGQDIHYNSATSVDTSTPLVNGGNYPYGDVIIVNAQPIGVNAPAGATDGIATGTVVFTDTFSAGAVNSGALNVAATGIANWLPAGLPAGSHSIVGSYSGDASFHASSSAPLTFIINKVLPTALLTASPAVIPLGSSTTLSLVVGVVSTSPPPTGTVTFNFGSTLLGTSPVVSCQTPPANTAPPCSNGYSGYSLAQSVAAGLPLGTDSISAAYSGDANFDPANASPITVLVEQNAGLAATANPNPVSQLQSTVVTATVTAVSGLPVPTGYVSMSTPNYICGSNPPLTNGSTSCTFQGNLLGLGGDTIAITYFGDTVYAPSQTTVTVTVTSPFSVTGTPVTIGAPGDLTGNASTITVTPAGGFTGAVNLSCSLATSPSGAQFLPTCTVPASIDLAGTTAATTTMTIATTVSTSAALASPGAKPGRWLAAGSAVTLGGLFFCGVRARGWRRGFLLPMVFVFLLFGGLCGCAVLYGSLNGNGGGRGGGGGGGGGGVTGTTPGTYTFTVTAASQGVSSDGTVTVVVQ